jgi:hypothetical protein
MINGLTVNPEVMQSAHREVFVVECRFMLGDADSYPTGTIVLETQEQVIALKNMFDHAKWTRDYGYQRDPLYRTFVDMLECEEDEEFFQNDHDAWGYGKFSELLVLWYDDQGLPHSVDFWWKD